MGDFDDHVRYGYAAHLTFSVVLGLLGVAVGVAPTLILGLIGISFPFVLGGAVFPDIDHHASKPHQAFVFISAVLVYAESTTVLWHNGDEFLKETVGTIPNTPIPDTVMALLSVCIGAGFVTWSATYLIAHFRPRHRGVTHQPFFGLLVSLTMFCGVWYGLSVYDYAHATAVAGTFGSAFFTGILSHLSCDRMLAVPDVSEVKERLPMPRR